ncbi:Sel1-like repeat family protein [Skeletonema marinoi]|uniref:Sel1-like repeat family protein n=1 Tax=Skeletonema marinoi TaxID=267567 RepID=A0AAD9D4D0_9STRA|nr:Sel1-like repeat family protein [Skeletonema marinoi]
MKRVERNDADAMGFEGTKQRSLGNYSNAITLYTKAAEQGNMAAHYNLSCMYNNGHGVEKDKGKAIHHLEEAAIGGHSLARHILGEFEFGNKKADRAVKHWVIAANHGFDASLSALKRCYGQGSASKEDFAAALRGHQAAVDATKSPQRAAAEEYRLAAIRNRQRD